MRYLAPLLLLVVAACAAPAAQHAAGSSIPVGHYRVVALEVIPADATIANSNGFKNIQPVIFRGLATKLQSKANGPDVWLTVRVTQLDLQMSTAMAVWAGDNFTLATDVVVSEPNTRQEVASSHIVTDSTKRAGLAGAIGNAIYSQDEQIEAMLAKHVDRIVESIYPKD